MPRDHQHFEVGDAYETPDAGSKRRIKAIPVPRLSETQINPRQFGMGKRYQYGVVTVGASPGGVGKTSLSTLEAIAWILNKPLTGEYMRARGNAWLITAEESSEEMYRRVIATCKHFKIDPEEIYGRLFITSTQETPQFKVMRIGENGKLVITEDADDVIAEMRENNIGYLSVDPFVTTHEGDESDNGTMDTATRVFCRIANISASVVALFHHVVKADDPEAHAGNLSRVRGASGITNAARHAFTIASINKETQAKYDLTDEEAVRVMRMDTGLKPNYVLKPTEPLWFWRESVTLDNAVYDDDGKLLWEADEVGVLRPFSMENLTAERRRIEDARLEPERAKTAQIVADHMTADRMPMIELVNVLLKAEIFGDTAKTKLREMIAEAIPLAHANNRSVRINGDPGIIYLRRLADHDRAGLEVVRQVLP